MSPALRAAVVTVSDRSARGEREDLSGPALVEAIRAANGEVTETVVVPDDAEAIAAALLRLCDELRVPLILTTGGTGFAPRDVTPEATRRILEKEAPGLSEHARSATVTKTRFAVLSRGIAGIRGRSLVINLPGSPKGARETFEVLAPLLPHALSVLDDGTDDHPSE